MKLKDHRIYPPAVRIGRCWENSLRDNNSLKQKVIKKLIGSDFWFCFIISFWPFSRFVTVEPLSGSRSVTEVVFT